MQVKRRLRLERLFERWLEMHGGNFEARIYEALTVGAVLGLAAGALVVWLLLG